MYRLKSNYNRRQKSSGNTLINIHERTHMHTRRTESHSLKRKLKETMMGHMIRNDEDISWLVWLSAEVRLSNEQWAPAAPSIGHPLVFGMDALHWPLNWPFTHWRSGMWVQLSLLRTTNRGHYITMHTMVHQSELARCRLCNIIHLN